MILNVWMSVATVDYFSFPVLFSRFWWMCLRSRGTRGSTESRNDRTKRNVPPPLSMWHARRSNIFIGSATPFFFSRACHLRPGRKPVTNEPWKRRTAICKLHCITPPRSVYLVGQFAGRIHPFGGCRTVTSKHRNQCKIVTDIHRGRWVTPMSGPTLFDCSA